MIQCLNKRKILHIVCRVVLFIIESKGLYSCVAFSVYIHCKAGLFAEFAVTALF